jgi:hypothetical protein
LEELAWLASRSDGTAAVTFDSLREAAAEIGRLRGEVNRLNGWHEESIAPAEAKGDGEWYTSPQGSHCIDFDGDPANQLSILLKSDGTVSYAYLRGDERGTGHGLAMLKDAVKRWAGDTPQPAGGEAVALTAWVGTMQASNGTNYYVCVGFPGGKYITPQVYDIRGRADYDVAEWKHMLGQGPKPDILAFDTEGTIPPAAQVQHPDDVAVDRFAAAMKAKLAEARAKGRGGWDDDEDLEQHLSNLLRDHVEKGDPRDVANFCCFLWNRGEGIAKAAQVHGEEVEQMTGDLLPCPFCGKSNQDRWPCEWLDGSGANVIRCTWCHGAAPMNSWNRRAAHPSACELGAVRELVAKWRSDAFEQTSTGVADPRIVCAYELEAALAQVPAVRVTDEMVRAAQQREFNAPKNEPMGATVRGMLEAALQHRGDSQEVGRG